MPVDHDLKGRKISETYQNIVQAFDGKLYDGNGNYVADIGSVVSTSNLVSFVAGEDIVQGQCVFISDDGRVYVYVNTDFLNIGKFVGIANESKAAGQSIDIIVSGFANVPGVFAGKLYYVDADGGLTFTKPSTGFIQQLGLGFSTGVLSIAPQAIEENNVAKIFKYVQTTPSDTWTIQHNLGYKPSVTVIDSAGSVLFGDIEHNGDDQLTLYFFGGFAGEAHCS